MMLKRSCSLIVLLLASGCPAAKAEGVGGESEKFIGWLGEKAAVPAPTADAGVRVLVSTIMTVGQLLLHLFGVPSRG